MKLVFFTYFYRPDVSPGAFRSEALVRSLSKKKDIELLHVITTQPNRYSSFTSEEESFVKENNIILI